MTSASPRFVAVLVGAVLAAAVSACAPATNTEPPVPATLPAYSADPVTSPPTAAPFVPTPLPTGRTGSPPGGLPPPSTLTDPDPDVAAGAALTAYHRADTALDLGPADAHRRALPWTTGQLAADIRNDRPVTAPGAAWTTLAAHRGYTTVTVTRAYDDGAPTDTPLSAYRQFTVTLTPRGRDGWTGPLVTHTDFLTLNRTPSGWRVTTLQDDN